MIPAWLQNSEALSPFKLVEFHAIGVPPAKFANCVSKSDRAPLDYVSDLHRRFCRDLQNVLLRSNTRRETCDPISGILATQQIQGERSIGDLVDTYCTSEYDWYVSVDVGRAMLLRKTEFPSGMFDYPVRPNSMFISPELGIQTALLVPKGEKLASVGVTNVRSFSDPVYSSGVHWGTRESVTADVSLKTSPNLERYWINADV